MNLRTCNECREWFGVYDHVPTALDAFDCDYHLDFTGRKGQKKRLIQEWCDAGDKTVAELR